MHKLNFKSNKTLRSLAKETLNADKFKIAYTKKTTTQKGFFLVKDEGIYLMNSYVNEDGERKNVNSVVYASDTIPSMINIMIYGRERTKLVAMTLQRTFPLKRKP